MRTYVAATGLIFALLVVAHVWRVFAESARLVTDPWYIGITLCAAGLAVWAAVLVLRKRKLT